MTGWDEPAPGQLSDAMREQLSGHSHEGLATYDHADLTVDNAHRVVYEFLSGLAARRRDAGLAPRG